VQKRIFFILLLFIVLFSMPAQAAAHPADVYAHTIHVTLSQTGLQIKWEIKPGPMLTSYLWYDADANQDGTLSQQEADNWGRARATLMTATLDDQPLPLLMDSVQMPSDLNKFQAGQEFITFTLSAKLPANAQRLILTNGMEPKISINWFYLSAVENAAFLFPDQKNNSITIDLVQNRALAADQSKLLTAWDSGTPSLPAGQQKDVVTSTAEQVVPELAKRTPQDILLDLVRTKDFSISFYAFALAISLALGALHALTPGHGKTVVAAYLVGSRGTARHAIVLGSVVTLTHTGSVFLLGIITLAASQYILPTRIIPALEIVSGLMIVGLGFYLLWQRFLYWRKSAVPTQEKPTRKYSLTPSLAATKKMAGTVKIQKVPENFHHHGDGKMHSHDVPETITWRSLITLGISGGLVPCPDAIAILLVAIAIQKIFLGLALIISFSIGLAVVLIAIGLLMVSGSRLFARMDAFNKLVPFMPIVSALIVLLLGLGLTYGAVAKLGLGSTSTQTESALGGNAAQIVYLNDDENQNKQLFATDVNGSDSRKLTAAPKGVVDFAISPDQTQVVYVEQTDDLGYNLWMLNLDGSGNRLAVACKQAICSQPIWSPDGKHVVYEYMPLDEGSSSLWWFDVATDKAQPVFQEARLPGANPRWSPNGEWLSYATPDGIRLNQLESGENRLIANTLGAAVQWAPDSKSFLIRDVIIKQDQFVTQLFLYDLASKSLTNVNANENMENILAAWSPDGKRIAVVRRDLSIPRGDQIWLMRADGSEAHVITHTPAVLHGSLNWSPDGNYILYDLYLLDSFPLTSQLEMVNVNTGEIVNLKVIGYNPKWVWKE
jgi:ABC-type nickel/cobalt efflux system permease component RcnA/Tol biopolymer transport system component